MHNSFCDSGLQADDDVNFLLCFSNLKRKITAEKQLQVNT
jgi:hypothetical protein